MKATVRHIGKIAVVDLSGKITIGEGDVVLRERVTELLEGGHQRLLLNLERVSYMDSAGIGELVACYKRAKEKDGMGFNGVDTHFGKTLAARSRSRDLTDGEVFVAKRMARTYRGQLPAELRETLGCDTTKESKE